MSLDRVRRALNDISAGKIVILVDDEDRENEGDLCMAAEKVTPEAINFMAKHGRGLICLTLNDEKLRQLELPMMVENNTSPFATAFTVSIEAREGVTTGISAADRAQTIKVAVAPEASASDLVSPGHIFPLRARPGGVLVRTGQTEGSVDLARLAGLNPAGVICEVMNEDGTMARMPELEVFAKEHDLVILSVADLIEYRLTTESLVARRLSREVVHPVWGPVTLHAYGTTLDARQHLVVVKGDITQEDCVPLVRVHSGYPLSNVFGDLLSDDRAFLNAALEKMGAEERGVLVCMDRGTPVIPLEERLSNLGTTEGESTKNPMGGTLREFGVGAQILRDLGLQRIRLLSNNPRRIAGLEGYGLEVLEVISLAPDQDTNVEPQLGVVEGGRSEAAGVELEKKEAK